MKQPRFFPFAYYQRSLCGDATKVFQRSYLFFIPISSCLSFVDCDLVSCRVETIRILRVAISLVVCRIRHYGFLLEKYRFTFNRSDRYNSDGVLVIGKEQPRKSVGASLREDFGRMMSGTRIYGRNSNTLRLRRSVLCSDSTAYGLTFNVRTVAW